MNLSIEIITYLIRCIRGKDGGILLNSMDCKHQVKTQMSAALLIQRKCDPALSSPECLRLVPRRSLPIREMKSTKWQRISKRLADPTNLKPLDKQELLQSSCKPQRQLHKFAFDADQENLVVRLPCSGMSFPHDFGFLPRTIAPDWHPSSPVAMDDPRPGIASARHRTSKEHLRQNKTRNDRLLALRSKHQYATCAPADSLAASLRADDSSSTTTISKARSTNCSAAKQRRRNAPYPESTKGCLTMSPEFHRQQIRTSSASDRHRRLRHGAQQDDISRTANHPPLTSLLHLHDSDESAHPNQWQTAGLLPVMDLSASLAFSRVGFIGAGAIVRKKRDGRRITTASTSG